MKLSFLFHTEAYANFTAKAYSPQCGRDGQNNSHSRGGSRNNSQRGRGSFLGNSVNTYQPSTNSTLVCQVCNHHGHSALSCIHCFNQAYTKPSSVAANFSSLADNTWYPNTVTIHHITSDLAKLNMHASEYLGDNQL